MYSGIFGCLWLVFLILLVGWPCWRIFEKLGYPGVASLIMYVPIANLVALWYAALNPMPFEQELQRWRGSVPTAPPPPPPPIHP